MLHRYLFFLLIFIFLPMTSALVCPAYNYASGASCLSCSYFCYSCTSSSDCSSCNTTNDHRSNMNQKACVCDTGYYDDKVSSVCPSCTTRITNCVDCFYNSSFDSAAGSIQYGCFKCDTGYKLVNNQCNALPTCPAGQGINLSTQLCQACPVGCLACSTSTICTSCDQGSNYFLSSGTCVLCTINGCSVCSSLTVCQTCQAHYHLSGNVCVCDAGYYYNTYSGTCQACSNYCKTCSGPSAFQCLTCDSTHFRVLVGNQCQCDSYNYVQSSTGPTCTQVSSNLCPRGYVLNHITNLCVEICGDGWNLSYQCDDGNSINTDGCSDSCRIEEFFDCMTPGTGTTVCRLVAEVNFTQVVLKKDFVANTLYFQFHIVPISVAYNKYNLTKILHFRGGYIQLTEARYQNQILYVTANYDKNLQGKSVQLQVRQDHVFNPTFPQDYQTLYNTTKATFKITSQIIKMNTTNNLLPNYYTDDVYIQAAQVKKGVFAVMILSVIVSIATLFVKNSMSAIINIGALQTGFIGLVTVKGLHPVIASLLELRPALGYSNLEMFQFKNNLNNVRVNSVGFVQNFANNFNIMFFVQLSFLAAAALANLAAHRKPMIKLASLILQRQALLVILFNLPTVYFTFTLMMSVSLLGLAFAVVALGIIIYQFVHLLVAGKNYFGFKEIFDLTQKGHFKKFVVFYFLSRLGTCLSFSFINVQPFKSLIAGAAFEAAFILFITFFRPFYHTMNNIFMMIAEIMMISFLSNLYAAQALQIEERQNSVHVTVYLLGAIPIIALINLIYSVIIDIKEGGKKLKAFNELIQAKNKSKEIKKLEQNEQQL